MRALLDPATLINNRLESFQSSFSAPSNPPTPPLTPTPPSSESFPIPFELINPLAIDVNENDQAGKQSPLKSKRVTFAPEIVVQDVEIEESVLQTPLDLFPAMNTDFKDMVKVSWAELWLSHSALVLVLLAATAFYHWLPVGQ